MFRLSVLALALAVSACAGAPPPYAHPTKPKAEWNRDWTSCRRWADRQVAPRGDPGMDERTSNPFREAERDEMKRRMRAMAAACMEEKGYVPAGK